MNKILIAIVLTGLVVSGIRSHDHMTWFLEIAPILIGLPILVYMRERFLFSRIVCVLLAVHAIILMIGGTYTYAEVPFGFWLKDMFHLSRNPYDRIGHFFQGLVPVLIAREVLIRHVFPKPRWIPFLALAVVMFVSSFYELIEWWSALVLGQGADQFLGTQGDPFDTQADMFMALIGGIFGLLFLSKLHDRSIHVAEKK